MPKAHESHSLVVVASSGAIVDADHSCVYSGIVNNHIQRLGAGKMRMDKILMFSREVLKLRQSDLAKKLGVCRSLVAKWEAGDLPRAQYIIPLCDALRLSPNELFDWRPDDEQM